MNTKEELNLILTLLRKHNLPLSPILEYAINEKIDECSGEESHDGSINDEEMLQVEKEHGDLFGERKETKQESLEIDSNSLRVVEFGKRGVAVVGDTKSHRISLRAMGGYYMPRTVYGPAWIFPLKQQKRVQAYVDGDTSVVDSWEKEYSSKTLDKNSSRYIIRVKYPDGKISCDELVWKTLLDVVKYAGAERVRRLNIVCMGDNLVSPNLNGNPIYRSAQKKCALGLYLCTYSSTAVKYNQILRINRELDLGLIVEKVDSSEGVGKDQDLQNQTTLKDDCAERLKFEEDKRIGYTIRLLPSQLEGVIIRTKVDKKGVKKLVVKTTLSGDVLEINDLPYLYEVLQRETKKTDESGMVVTTPKVNVNDNTDVLREYNKAEEHDESVEKSEKMEPYRSTSEVEEIENIYLEKDGDDTRVEFSDSHIIPEKEFTDENRNGKTWTEDEEELIKNYFQEGKDYATIAKLVGRTELAIKSRLAKLGLIDYTYGQEESIDDLEIEHVYLDEKGNTIRTEIESSREKKQEEGWQLEERENNKNAEEFINKIDRRWNDFARKEAETKDIEETTEKESENEAEQGFSVPIGKRVRLLPSQIEGVVVNHLISKSGERRIVIEKDDGSQMSAQDHPYLYEIVKKKRKRIGEARRDSGNRFEVKRKETERVNDGSLKEQFRAFLAVRKSESTTNGYTSMLDSSIRKWIKQEVDAQADSIFSYTTAEDVQICIDLLKEIPGFRKENDRKHNGLTAALNQYLLFIKEREN